MKKINMLLMTCLVLIIVASDADIISASDGISMYIAGLEGRDCKPDIVKNSEYAWIASFRSCSDDSKYYYYSDVETGTVVFHGGGCNVESIYMTSDSKYGIEFAAAGLIEGKLKVGEGVKYRFIVRIVGNYGNGVIVNCESPYVNESEIDSCIRKTAKRAIMGMRSGGNDVSKKVENDDTHANTRFHPGFVPYFMLGVRIPFASLNKICGIGKGISMGSNVGRVSFTDAVEFHPSLRLSLFDYSIKRSNVDSVKLSRMMFGCDAAYGFKSFTLILSQYFGYQLGRMKFRYDDGGKYCIKYYHSPVTELCSSVVVSFGKCDFMFETSYVLFREKKRTDREISFSTGGMYRL